MVQVRSSSVPRSRETSYRERLESFGKQAQRMFFASPVLSSSGRLLLDLYEAF